MCLVTSGGVEDGIQTHNLGCKFDCFCLVMTSFPLDISPKYPTSCKLQGIRIESIFMEPLEMLR